MAAPHPDLIALAESLADGARVDWDLLMAGAGAAETPRLEALRDVGRVIEAYRSAFGGDAGCAASGREGPLEPGSPWGSLEIVAHLGAGTFGHVYRARDTRLDRDVALKLLHASDTDGGPLKSSVITEGRLLARVRHPNVATVYGADVFDSRVGVWMELVEGRTLEAECADRGPLSADEARAIGIDLCGALAAVHAAGVLHRDVKPQNVMRDQRDGRVVLTDFSAGRERPSAAETEAVLPATMAGSPLYLAPEVLAGGRATERSDLYSLGVLLFRMATGEYPVSGQRLDDIKAAHQTRTPSRLSDWRPELPAQFCEVVERALSTDPSARFESAAEMAEALKPGGPHRSRWLKAAAVAAVLAATAAIGAMALRPAVETIPFSARDWLLIGDFENKTGDATFDDLPEQVLGRELAHSGYINVVPRARIEDALLLMHKPPVAVLDATLAREVSRLDGGIRAMLTGSVARAGSGFVLTTAVANPVDGTTVARFTTEVAQPGELLPRLADQALRIRRTFGDKAAASSGGDASQSSARSFEAVKLYSRAMALLDGENWRYDAESRQRFLTAESLLTRATEIDPGFASAWALLAHASCWGYADTKCLPQAERAAKAAASADPVEQLFTQGFVNRRRAYEQGAPRQQLLAAAAAAYESVLQQVPDHYWTLTELVTVYRELGRLDDADLTTMRAAAVRPQSLAFQIDLARVHLRRRDTPRLAATAARALAAIPESAAWNGGELSADLAWLRTWKVHDAWLRRDAPAALAAAREAEQRWSSNTDRMWLFGLGAIYFGLGRPSDVGRIAEKMPPELREHTLLVMAANQEDWPEFRRRLASSAPWFDPATSHMFTLSWARMFDRAERVLAELRHRGEVPWYGLSEMEGQLRVSQERYAEGLPLLEPFTLPETRPRYRAYEMAAIARRGVGDLAGAIALLEPLDENRALAVLRPWSVKSWLRCRALLADLYRENREHSATSTVEDDLRKLLAVAEPGDPILTRINRGPY